LFILTGKKRPNRLWRR